MKNKNGSDSLSEEQSFSFWYPHTVLKCAFSFLKDTHKN